MLKKYKLKSLNLVYFGGSRISKECLDDVQKDLPHVELSNNYGKIFKYPNSK